jgi:hypothetical protein
MIVYNTALTSSTVFFPDDAFETLGMGASSTSSINVSSSSSNLFDAINGAFFVAFLGAASLDLAFGFGLDAGADTGFAFTTCFYYAVR